MFSLKKQKAIKQAYETYYTMLFSVAMKKIGDIHHVEDICHDVFIALSEQYDQVNNTKNWLLGTLNRQIVYFYRKKQASHSKVSNIEDFDHIPEKDPSHEFDINIILNDIFESEGKISRQIFEMKNVYGWSLTGIAKELKLTRRQVRYIYEKVVRSLLDKLKKQGISTFGDII